MAKETGKTSTFTLHHDRCDPSKWTLRDWQALAHFAQFGDMQSAAALSRAGLQLVLSDHHAPTGGTVEHIGWAKPGEITVGVEVGELGEVVEDDISEVCAIYRGPTQYAATYEVGEDGSACHEHELFPTEQEAKDFLVRFSMIQREAESDG